MKEKSTGNVVLVADGGGRGAVLVDKYAQSEHVGRVLAIPGNDLMGMNTEKPVQIYPLLKTTSISEIEEICEREKVDLVDVAQDRAVGAGLTNALIAKGISVVGPTMEAGRIEWDKAFARQLGFSIGLPQPNFFIRTREESDYALNRIDLEPNRPRFIKAAFLADGKGAKPTKNKEEAKKAIVEIATTEAGKVFLVEDWIKGDNGQQGEEFSLFVVSDGERYRVLGNAQDYKRENNFDEGENTGSMGCSSPTSLMTPRLLRDSKKEIIEKTITKLKERGTPYKGILYLGGMVISKKNRPYASFPDEFDLKPYVVEFNARWGDPEAQAIIPGLKVDFFELGKAVCDGDISKLKIKHDGKVRVAITGSAKGYPREDEYRYVKGKRIFGIEDAMKLSGIKIYSGAIRKINGKNYAWGGRLFYIVAEGNDIIEAKARGEAAIAHVHVEGDNLKTRTDIGWRDVERYYKPPHKITVKQAIEGAEILLMEENKRIGAMIRLKQGDN
jgi:phosphoribosylamine--glycine ligase